MEKQKINDNKKNKKIRIWLRLCRFCCMSVRHIPTFGVTSLYAKGIYMTKFIGFFAILAKSTATFRDFG